MYINHVYEGRSAPFCVYQVVDQKTRNTDQAFQGLQKALMAALAAIAPVLDLAGAREDKDQELEDLGKNIVEAMKQKKKYMYVYICMHVYIYIHIYVCVYVFIYIYVYIYVYTYMVMCRERGTNQVD